MKGLLLISGGIDSPVAGYLMLRQGMELSAVNFENRPGQEADKMRRMIRALEEHSGQPIRLLTVPYNKLQEAVQQDCSHKYQCVLCKRFMYKVSAEIALEQGCDVLVTGENLAQVASQTLDNMAVISSSVKIPVLRPLLGNDKQETIKTAREIGTYDISIDKAQACPYAPKAPATKASMRQIELEENRLPQDMVAELAQSAKECS
jgi:thiamine biosynthesis protein ThiI